MRFICFVFLLAFVGAVGWLVYENQQEVALTVLNRNFTTSIPVLAGGTYMLGMLSGWTVVGMLRRTLVQVIRTPGEYVHPR